MKQWITMGLLKQVDSVTEERIADEFPPPWDMEALYQKSFQKYLQKAEETPVCISRHRRVPYQVIGTAACLLLIVGLGVGVWTRQPKIEVQPPEPPASPVTAETTEISRESEPSAPTTAAASTTEPTAAPTQELTESLPAVLPTETEEIPAGSTQPETSPEQPIEQRETAAPVIEPSQTDAPTEPTAAPTEQVTEERPEPSDEQIAGFTVERYSSYRKIICTDAFPAPDGELQPYSLEGDVLELVGTSEKPAAEPVRTYEIRDLETGRTFTVTQREYAEFALNVEEGELIDIGLGRVHGFFLLQGESCTLYWFCDGEGFCVSGDTADLGSFMTIVRSFTPAEN